MSRCINDDEALKIIKKMLYETALNNFTTDRKFADACEEIAEHRLATWIDAVPTADVPQWIPCNERLPKEDGDYLVTLDFAWGKEIEMGEWFEGEWINDNSHVTVAWMPLPNPWKGEADGRTH